MGLNLCERCAADCRHERNPNEIVVKCGAFKPPMTNGDRIRAMSDEELAMFLDETQRRECEALHLVNHDGTLKFESCQKGWLVWLRHPTEEAGAN